MTRYRTSGNNKPWVVHPGYTRQSRHSARWERPKGEPSLFAGTLIVLAGFTSLAMVAAVMS